MFRLHVRLGEYNLQENLELIQPQDFDIADRVSAPFSTKDWGGDITILKLNRDAIYNSKLNMCSFVFCPKSLKLPVAWQNFVILLLKIINIIN